jgi:hypothetical protein
VTPAKVLHEINITYLNLLPSWLWWCGSCMHNYLCNQYLSPLSDNEFESRSWWCVLDTTICDEVCQWFATGRWFSSGTPVSSTNKTDRYDLNEILLKVTLNLINKPTNLEAITSCLSESDVSLYVICIYVRIFASNTI